MAAGSLAVVAEVVEEVMESLLPISVADKGARFRFAAEEAMLHQTCNAVIGEARMVSVDFMEDLF